MIAERPPAGEQLEEQQAEGVDVGRGGDRLAGELFGAGVFGGQRQAGACFPSPRSPCAIGVEELGDAEVEQPDLAALGEQDVGRLEVAVDHEVNVGVVHRLADLFEQGQALVERRVAGCRRPTTSGSAVDVLEGEVGDAGGVDAAVEELRDAAMGEAGQALALDPEAPAELAALESATDPLQRDLAAEPGLVTFGQPDLAHAALAEQPHEPVGTDPLRSGSGLFRHPLLERQRPARRRAPQASARARAEASGPSSAASPGSARRTWRSARGISTSSPKSSERRVHCSGFMSGGV